MEVLGTALAAYGLPGAVIGALLYLLREKDKEIKELNDLLNKEKDARVSDAKGYTDLALKLQSEVIGAVNKLTAVFEDIKKTIGTRR